MLLGPLAVVGLTLFVVWAGLASASSTSSAGKVHLYEADTALAGNLGTVILTGAITDQGTDHQGAAGGGKLNKIVLSKGSFEVNVSPVGKKLASLRMDPNTCATDGTVTGQVPIVNGTGTGAYRGIHGTFHTTVSLASINPRLKNHACNPSPKHYPGVLLVKGSGPVHGLKPTGRRPHLPDSVSGPPTATSEP